jgi:hypothetical protein
MENWGAIDTQLQGYIIALLDAGPAACTNMPMRQTAFVSVLHSLLLGAMHCVGSRILRDFSSGQLGCLHQQGRQPRRHRTDHGPIRLGEDIERRSTALETIKQNDVAFAVATAVKSLPIGGQGSAVQQKFDNLKRKLCGGREDPHRAYNRRHHS